MKWSESAWQESNEVYEKIVQHPFNLELMNGTLHVEKFKFYIAQDSVYLGAFGRVLALIAARTNHSAYALDFIRFSEGPRWPPQTPPPVATPNSPTPVGGTGRLYWGMRRLASMTERLRIRRDCERHGG